MTNLIERLRSLARAEHDDLSIGDEAADEIERLRAELAECRRVAEGVRARMLLRGFYVPQDTADLIAAIQEAKP